MFQKLCRQMIPVQYIDEHNSPNNIAFIKYAKIATPHHYWRQEMKYSSNTNMPFFNFFWHEYWNFPSCYCPPHSRLSAVTEISTFGPTFAFFNICQNFIVFFQPKLSSSGSSLTSNVKHLRWPWDKVCNGLIHHHH